MPQPPATKPLGLPFIELQSVDSTNNYARQQIHAGLAQHGMTIFAHEQVAGKGQRGRNWASQKDANLVLSLVVKPQPLQLVQQFRLSVFVAVAVHDLFVKYAGDDSKIKWPNDLYWQDRKAGGILIENIVSGRNAEGGREWISIIGIGININQTSFGPEIKNPVSLKQITGKDHDPVDLAKELCHLLELRFRQLMNGGFDELFNEYLQHLYKRKVKVKLKKGAKIFEALIEGVSPAGKLITQHAIAEEFEFGEVEWII